MRKREAEISELVGLTLTEITAEKGDDTVMIRTACGRTFRMFNDQDYCEIVSIEDVNGNLSDLIGSPILMAEESSNSDVPPSEYAESWTWTFYKLATIKGTVVVRWLGDSNGYYSESVYFYEVLP